MNNVGITLPQVVALDANKIIFLSGNLTSIELTMVKDNTYLTVFLIGGKSFRLKSNAQIKNFLAQFPEQILIPATNLRNFYRKLIKQS